MNVIITPLGTVSPHCKKDTNCPGFLIEYNRYKYLLDCGNGITRFLNFPDDLNNLNVFITHYHFDHYGDIGSIQYDSYVYHNLGCLDNPINIYLPENDYKFRKKSILLNDEAYAEYKDISENRVYEIGNMKITFHNNRSHTIETFAIKLENSDFKIVYTSDVGTTNLDALIEFCKDSDLIICESSFLKNHNSSSKTHLTAYDAGLIAKLSNARKLLLTHFWPEEDKKLYLAEAKQNFLNTDVACEGKKLVLKRN